MSQEPGPASRHADARAATERVTGVGTWHWRPEPDLCHFSEELHRLMGTPPGEPISFETWLGWVHADDRAQLADTVERALATDGDFSAQYRLRTRDGGLRTFVDRGTCLPEAPGGVRMLGTILDVTDLLAVDAEARLWQALATQLPLGIALLERAADAARPVTTLAANPALGRLRAAAGAEADALPEAGARLEAAHPLATAMDLACATGTPHPVPDLELAGPPPAILEVTLLPAGPDRALATYLDVTARRELQRERDQLLRRSLTVAAEERRRVAERLHDAPIQGLSAALLRMDIAEQTGVSEQLGEIRALVRSAVDELRRLILELSPSDLPTEGLRTAIEDYVGQAGLRRDLDVTLHIEDLAAGEDALVTAYQTVQEALTNVSRHARARAAVVRVWEDDGQLRGEVTDDGVGLPSDFDLATASGLRLALDRLRVLDGTMAVTERSDGPGTRLWWALPLVSGPSPR